MSWVGWILFIFGCLRLIISFVNWITKPYLPKRMTRYVAQREVSVLIPARNEEKNIAQLLTDLSADGTGICEIIVYNDNSTDDTGEIVKKIAESNPKIRLVRGEKLPSGWLGKNYACYKLALEATGNYLLFLDADVRIRQQGIVRALRYVQQKGICFLSIFPEQHMPDYGTTWAVPLMNWILISLLPLIAVRKSEQISLSAANGQFMFFEAKTYRCLQPHKKFRLSAVEDIQIMKEYKRHKIKTAVLLGRNDVSCTMYHTLDEAIEGFSKNFFDFFGGSRLLCFLFAVATTVAPPLILLFNGILTGCIYLSVVVGIRVFVSLASKQSVKMNISRMIPQQYTLWRIIGNAFIKKNKRNLLWKGRNIYSDI